MGHRFQVETNCRECGRQARLEPLDLPDPACAACGSRFALTLTDPLRESRCLERCAGCGEHRIYRQKDFNRTAGLLVVLVGVAASLAVLPFSPLGAYAVLFGMAILDAIFYLLLPEVAICYRCRTRHKGWNLKCRPDPFDLLTAELIDHQIRQSGGKNP